MHASHARPMEGDGSFDELTPEASLIRLEEEVRRFWRRHDVPAAVRAARRTGPPLTVYTQPLAIDHARADRIRLLATADLLARYHTMQGAATRHRVGWAGHGLPLEVAVERSLAPDPAGLEEATFNHACRQRALDEVALGERLAGDLGLWLEADNAYITLAPEAVGLTWGALHRLWQAGRLRQEWRVVPFCPRCATPLSVAEAARRAAPGETLATWLLLPWEQEPGVYLLVWTSLPWALVGMVALAAHPEATYVLVALPGEEGGPRHLLLAEAALRRQGGTLPGGDGGVVRRLPGKALGGTTYHPPFTFVPAGEQVVEILLDDSVPLEQGSGLLPVTPSFEARSLALATARDLPVPRLLDDWGRFDETVAPWQGLSPLDAAPLVVDNLRSRGLLLHVDAALAPQSLCPHCQTPLLPLARHVWLVETGSGPWVVGRDRPWGTPLPIWICDGCGEVTCLAGLDDLTHRSGLAHPSGRAAAQIDPHRPEVDRLTLACATCGGAMHRVPEVVDADFEAAIVPWAAAVADEPDLPSLAVGLGDRHLGWLGDAAEMAALLRGTLAWEQAVALGEAGDRPAWQPDHSRPADAERWAGYVGGTPQEAEERFLRPLWTLAAAGDRRPGKVTLDRPAGVGALLDRWLQARLYQVVAAVGQALDAAGPGRAAGDLAALAADLATWYLPLHPGSLPAAALDGQVLALLARLLAPFVPHLAEAIYRRQTGYGGPESSVHLATWPAPPESWQDTALLAQVELVWQLAALGRTARTAAGLEADRLLRPGVVGLEADAAAAWPGPGALHDLLARALAVDEVEVLPHAAAPVTWHLSLAPGREPAREVPPEALARALADLDAGEAATLAQQLRAGLSISLQAGGQALTLLPADVQVTPRARPGWTAAARRGLVVSIMTGGS